jgi:Ca-activated chloride channel family protein
VSEFHFLRPAWFVALVPVLVLLVLLWRWRGPAAGWRDIVAPALLPHLVLGSGQSVRRSWLPVLGLGWLLAVVALAGPTWERQPQPLYRLPADRIVVLDMSPSMAANDLRPDRLTRARLLIRDLLEQVQEGRTALVVFGAEPHVVTPLTDDVATIEALLPALSVDILPAPGDQGGLALRTAGELLARVASANGEILLLSDGVDDLADSLDAVHELRKRGVNTAVLGVGTATGAPEPAADGGFAATATGSLKLTRLDESGLVTLAKAGGGRYQRLDQGPIAALLAQQPDRDPAHARTDERGLERWVEQGPWLLLPLILIAASGFRRGWLGVWLVLLIAPPAHAFSWRDLWLRPDQQASRLLERGEVSAAAERFQDPHWRATARYQAGDYAAAAAGFTGEDADSRYNRGNALARAGRLQEALAAYDQALQRQPDHADAGFNRALIEKLLREQPQAGEDRQSGASPDEQQAGSEQGARAQQDQQQPPGDAPADPPQGGDAASQTPSVPPQSANPNAGKTPSEDDSGSERTADAGAVSEERKAQALSEHAIGPDQARSDVAPSLGEATGDRNGTQTRSAEAPAEGKLASRLVEQREPMSEQELALEQWLRQVPDDPAGLLRRKFMLEHLLRQRRQDRP